MQALVLKLTAGIDDPERVSQAFTVAATAVAVGASVSVWLTGEATWLGVAGRAEELSLPFAPSLAQARDLVISDARLTVCSQCAARRELTQENFLPGIRLAGAASFVEESLTQNTQALVY